MFDQFRCGGAPDPSKPSRPRAVAPAPPVSPTPLADALLRRYPAAGRPSPARRARLERVLADAAAWASVVDPVAFVNGLDQLARAPYDTRLHGQDPARLLRLRDRHFGSGNDGQHPVAASRAACAAWALLEAHPTDAYVPGPALEAFCARNAVDAAEVKAQMVARRDGAAFTLPEVRRWERGLQGMLDACEAWVPPAASGGPAEPALAALSAQQASGCRGVMMAPVSLVQGGAGAGKTTMVAALIRAVSARAAASACRHAVVCVAFTHKAVLRLREALLAGGALHLADVRTVHSFVMAPGRPREAAERLLLVLDEASMLDLQLLGRLGHRLLRGAGAPRRLQVCMVGDAAQLPPVGRGEVFRQLVAADRGVFRLAESHRTGAPGLLWNFDRLLTGQPPATRVAGRAGLFLHRAPCVAAFVGAMVRKYGGAYQYLTWRNEDVTAINALVQAERARRGEVTGPPWAAAGRGGRWFVGDAVVFGGTGRSGRGGLTNGLRGTVMAVTPGVRFSVHWEDGRTLTVAAPPPGLALAYCLTVHKSQGSEYPRVCFACYDARALAARADVRLLYTAVTRAREVARVVCPPDGALEALVAAGPRPFEPVDVEIKK